MSKKQDTMRRINMLEIGTKAPAFELPDQNGDIHRLENTKGRW